mmetsp:Transcript_17687/g.27293  ORF Transcript_17687/g.27293 Transcript_17687/m.27293 type:complete len:716 (+) Transcript_17687:204-2351(+)
MFSWYDSVDSNATPDDIFRQEMERQRMFNKVGGDSSNDYDTAMPGTTTTTFGTSSDTSNNNTPFASTSSSTFGMNGGSPSTTTAFAGGDATTTTRNTMSGSFLDTKPMDPKTIDATLSEYSEYRVSDNWLNEDLIMLVEEMKHQEDEEEEWNVEQQNQLIEQEYYEEMKNPSSTTDNPNTNNIMMRMGAAAEEEPWDHYGDEDDETTTSSSSDDDWDNEQLKVGPNPKAAEFLMENTQDESPEEEETWEELQAQEEAHTVERLSKLSLTSLRLEKARHNPKAALYFQRPPNTMEGYDRMWVSAIDNACFKNLMGMFRNYGIQFADNFGDFQDDVSGGATANENQFATIEDMASYKARQVFDVTGLPCIASRTSFEIEPILPKSTAPGNPPSTDQLQQQSPNSITSGYHFNDIGPPVDHILEALQSSASEPTRVTRFKSCLCYYDGDMEVFDYGVCDVDLYFSNSMRTFIPMSSAIHEMCKTLQLTFGLEYQKWLKQKVQQVTSGGGGGGSGSSTTTPSTKLRDRVLKEGKVLPNDIIDVSTFMDSQVDVELMDECAKELANRFMQSKPTKILTVATTGLVIALPMAKYLQVPVVYARKERNVVMADTYQAAYSSKTVGKNRELLVSKNHIEEEDRILVVDDFLSSGASQEALLRIISDADATAVGVGVLLEKVYDSGRQSLSGYNVPIHSLCRVASVKEGVIQLVEEDGYEFMSN